MKNLSLKSKILAAAFAIGGLTAGATEAINQTKNGQQPTYNWTHFDRQGNEIGTLDDKTLSDARIMLGCPGLLSTVCATGQLESGNGSPTQTIFYD